MSGNLAFVKHAPRHDTINSWLDVLVALLDLPDHERGAVRAELESHLRERVRDLILAGESEHHATTTAIGELGDAATLARRYSQTIAPSHRRSSMQIAALSVAGAAAIFGIGAVGGKFSQPEPKSPPPAATPGSAAGSTLDAPGSPTPTDLVEGRLVDAIAVEGQPLPVTSRGYEPPSDPVHAMLVGAKFHAAGVTSWADFLNEISKSAPIKFIRWDVLKLAGLEPNSEVSLPEGDFSAWQALELANERLTSPVALRLVDGGFEVSTRENIDRRERSLVVYDVSPLMIAASAQGEEGIVMRTEEIRALVTAMVYPDGWKDNGGDLAEITRYGSKLFIQAPLRYHAKIEWLMTEIARPETASDAFSGSIARIDRVPVLSGLPIINQLFTNNTPVAPPAPGERYTFRISADGKVEMTRPDGQVVRADSFEIAASQPEGRVGWREAQSNAPAPAPANRGGGGK